MTFPPLPINWPDGQLSSRNRAPTLHRWESAGGIWRVQIDPMIFGYRVHIGRRWPLGSIDATPVPGMQPTEWPSYEVVYCCGRNRLALMMVPRLCIKILERFDEDAAVDQVRGAFPLQRRKPIELDPDCWRELAATAGTEEAEEMFELLAGQSDTVPSLYAGMLQEVS